VGRTIWIVVAVVVVVVVVVVEVVVVVVVVVEVVVVMKQQSLMRESNGPVSPSALRVPTAIPTPASPPAGSDL
jgi:hypothetical protein